MVQSPGFQFEDNAELVGLMGCEGGVTESDARIKSRLTWQEGTGCREAKQWGPAEEIAEPDYSETRDSFHSEDHFLGACFKIFLSNNAGFCRKSSSVFIDEKFAIL